MMRNYDLSNPQRQRKGENLILANNMAANGHDQELCLLAATGVWTTLKVVSNVRLLVGNRIEEYDLL
jgi:hypothetical protein